jgi:glycosyltransferase involved in cell wall biosynthesis
MWAGFCGASAVISAAALRLPSIVHVTGGELVALHDVGYGGCRTWRGRFLARATLAGATRVTCTSEPIRELIQGFGRRADRIPLGIDLERWPLREPRRRAESEKARLIHVASLNAVKDQETLLQAMRLIASAGVEFRLDVVGDDCTQGAIEARSFELGLANYVSFHGFLPQDRLRPLVESAHLAVFSSRHEAGPVAMLEAAALGVPSVGTNVGHIREWHGAGSLAVPCADPNALAAQIMRVLADEDLRVRLGNEALDRAAREDANHTVRSFDALYRQLSGTEDRLE